MKRDWKTAGVIFVGDGNIWHIARDMRVLPQAIEMNPLGKLDDHNDVFRMTMARYATPKIMEDENAATCKSCMDALRDMVESGKGGA